MQVSDLDKQIRAIVDIHGVSIGKIQEKSTWSVSYKSEPTEVQKTAILKVIDDFQYDGIDEVSVSKKDVLAFILRKLKADTQEEQEFIDKALAYYGV